MAFTHWVSPPAVGVENPSGGIAPDKTTQRRAKPPKDGGQVPALPRAEPAANTFDALSHDDAVVADERDHRQRDCWR
jgi:hypothetical protein